MSAKSSTSRRGSAFRGIRKSITAATGLGGRRRTHGSTTSQEDAEPEASRGSIAEEELFSPPTVPMPDPQSAGAAAEEELTAEEEATAAAVDEGPGPVVSGEEVPVLDGESLEAAPKAQLVGEGGQHAVPLRVPKATASPTPDEELQASASPMPCIPCLPWM
eukprot:CAMPEP_0118967096 /NCGR_PEP_ID=MMETSP1173-20130426/4513_1 /TAXON_ID=1034831 /ORGANISM="Rhizochromulina marina cf, Strain CCMP1243" /LENGTH=161 /DNA_ID=CAMNT_0006915997 /DNA_START=41 /DNA_END=526 /DNA_ORIENTATION=-